MNDEAVKLCSICHDEYVGWGNNAYPFLGRCCDKCARDFVLPARIRRQANDRKRNAAK